MLNEISKSYPDRQAIYTPKRGCPRSKGLFYCQDCEDLVNQMLMGVPVLYLQKPFCEKIFEGKICGKTHLGYEYCDGCAPESFSNHVGEYIILGYLPSGTQLSDFTEVK